MTLLSGGWLLTVVASSVLLGQTSAIPVKWIGTWKLNPQESKFGQLWEPGVPKGGLTFTGQTLKIEFADGHLKVSGDTVTSELGSLHEESYLNLDGKDNIVPPGMTISFRRIDDATFDIILRWNNKDIGNHAGENRFVFSGDGKKLIETKIHTEREVAPEGADPARSAVMRTSTTVLVFYRTFDSN